MRMTVRGEQLRASRQPLDCISYGGRFRDQTPRGVLLEDSHHVSSGRSSDHGQTKFSAEKFSCFGCRPTPILITDLKLNMERSSAYLMLSYNPGGWRVTRERVEMKEKDN